jgi:hypothetical protein
MSDNRVKRPTKRKKEAPSSADITNIKDNFGPNPIGSMNPWEKASKFCSFCRPWVIIKTPAKTRKSKMAKEFPLSLRGDPKSKKFFISNYLSG